MQDSAEVTELQEKLLKATSGAPDEYSRKLEGEMEKWSEQSRLAQNAAREAHDRQLAQAREAREMATADADQQAARHAELRRQYDELVVRSAEGASRDRSAVPCEVGAGQHRCVSQMAAAAQRAALCGASHCALQGSLFGAGLLS